MRVSREEAVKESSGNVRPAPCQDNRTSVIIFSNALFLVNDWVLCSVNQGVSCLSRVSAILSTIALDSGL